MENKTKAVILEGNAVNPGDISWEPVTRLCDTKIYSHTNEEEKWERLKDAEVIFINKIIMDEEVFQKNPQIKYVGVCATGYNVVDLEAAKRHGVVVTYVPAYSTPSVVQHTWAVILEMCCKINEHDKSVRNGDWIKSECFTYWLSPIIELEGKTLGIFGFGNIGRRVASVAPTFGMKVLVSTAHPEKYEKDYPEFRFVSREEVFRESDVISFHIPLTDDTYHLLNKENLGLCKAGVMIVNVSRGNVICEEDLREAILSGKVSAAALDVISEEPMNPKNPLIGFENVIITPHIAWASKEARERLVGVVASNYESFVKGNPVNIAI